MESSFLFAFFTAFISLSIFESSKASDSLYPNQSIRHPHTIVSAGGTFSLGFFSPGKTENYYLGIWYTRIPMNKFVWVGNRDYPFHNSATLSISTDGNIMITDGKMSYKVTNISVSGNAFAKLLDSGNLILKGQVQKAGIYWQSFDYPTDTLLPGMNLGDDFRFNPEHFWTLVSWSSIGDPTPGNFSLVADFSGLRSCNLIIKQGNETYWKSPIQGLTYSGQERNSTMTMEQQDHYTGYVSNGFWFSEVIPKNERHRISTFNLSQNITSGKGYVTFSANTKATSRIVLDVSGQLKQQIWSEHDRQWNSLVSSKCGFHSCGPFSFCDESAHTPCTCLKGFRPYSPYAWKEGDTYQGCVRKASLQCNDSRVLEKDGFYHMRNFILPSNQVKLHVNNTEDCRSASLGNCSWIAYALDYDQGCLVWENELFDLKIPLDGDTNGRDFYLKLAASELSTKVTHASFRQQSSFALRHTDYCYNLLCMPVDAKTWQLWTSESGLNSMDPALDNDPSTSTPVLLRYVQIALLCVQESATDRPTMSDVVSMLNNESAFLPSPKPPAFSNVRSAMESRSPMRIPETVNNVTITVLEAR
ncbi:hypothetical protein P3X46_033903 [Hevea brasiliensis]|uniref:Bulb-type lectin domain-containing protein n=1 Tax=Hevea brasiliensis TaxID=3981 RepID=A0ABQ9KA33_HEVBR|nr:hypothetical protein P3X46_033903 [Hevea brasiliensis]